MLKKIIGHDLINDCGKEIILNELLEMKRNI